MTRFKAALIGPVLAMAALVSSAQGQEAAVREAVTGTLAAWSEGDFDRFADYYHPDVRGFFLDGSVVTRGFEVEALRAAHAEGLRAEMTLRELETRVYGSTAVSEGYLDGTIGLPGGMSLSGSWRYSETRVLTDGVWRVVQYHFSQLAAGF